MRNNVSVGFVFFVIIFVPVCWDFFMPRAVSLSSSTLVACSDSQNAVADLEVALQRHFF